MATPKQTPVAAILAPLDGSDMGEFAAPYVASVARALKLPVVVTRIVEWSAWAASDSGYLLSPQVYKEVTEAAISSARDETQFISDELRAQGVEARPVVQTGDPREALLTLESGERCVLTVMATHGHSGVTRVAMGSVADYLTRHGPAPVLLVRARGPLVTDPPMERALVPVDGSTLSELGFEPLTLMAGALVRHITLVRVIDPDEPTGASREAKRYLAEIQSRLMSQYGELGVTVETEIRWGKASDEIVRASRDHHVVIMATHGKTGAMRVAYGSVAGEVIHSAETPVLMIRPQPRT